MNYLRDHYTDMDVCSILCETWMNYFELEDHGHWFTQWRQVDRFHQLLLVKTCSKNVAREVGCFSALSDLTYALISIIMGIAPRIAVSIHNAISEYVIKDSKARKENQRWLFEEYAPQGHI